MKAAAATLAFSLCAGAALAAKPAKVEAAPAVVSTEVQAQAQLQAPRSAASAANQTETASGKRVIEDDRVRIEETRIRGQLQSITVRSKLTGQDYEIIVGPGGRDPSQKGDASGQRAWSLFRF